MKKNSPIQGKSIKELRSFIAQSRRDIAKARLDGRVGRVKNVHTISGHKHQIAQALTQLKMQEQNTRSKS